MLLLLSAATALLGAFVLVTTALGFAHADVRGVRLEGRFELLFLAGLAIAVALCAAAAVGLLRGRASAVWLLAAVWPAFSVVCLVLDRITPAPGDGRSLLFYLGVGLLPAVVTLLLGRVRIGDLRGESRTFKAPQRARGEAS